MTHVFDIMIFLYSYIAAVFGVHWLLILKIMDIIVNSDTPRFVFLEKLAPCAMCHVGLAPHIMAWISALYSTLQAAVQINNSQSDYFSLINGIMRGCSLSLFIFILTLVLFLSTI